MAAEMDQFLARMSEVVECPIAASDRFRDLPGWCSLKAFGVLVTLENDFHRPMSMDEFSRCHTFVDLASACGIA